MMKRSIPKKLLLVTAMFAGLASMMASAAPQSDNSKKKRDNGDFVRGHANTKEARVVVPKTEQEAVANKRVVAAGIIEMELPEDRMVNLVEVKNADGTVSYMHVPEGEDIPTTDAGQAQGEVK